MTTLPGCLTQLKKFIVPFANNTIQNQSVETLEVCHSSLTSLFVSSYQSIVIKATATDEVTDEAYSGEVQVPIKRSLLQLEYLSITPTTFKADLMWTGFVS